MTEIGLEVLNREYLNKFWFIEAIAGFGESETREVVWDSKRLLPFVGPYHVGTEIKTLLVRVPSLDEADLQPLRAKIRQLWEGTGAPCCASA